MSAPLHCSRCGRMSYRNVAVGIDEDGAPRCTNTADCEATYARLNMPRAWLPATPTLEPDADE